MGSDLNRAKGKIRSAVAGMARDAARVGAAWGKAGASVAAAGARIGLAAGLIGGVVIKAFATFERQMIQVGAVTETLGTKDFPKLEKAARKAGRETEFTATQAALALEQLGLKGLTVNQILKALPATLELAAAASIDIATAATISAGQMRVFGLEAKDLSKINDILIATQNRSGASILDLSAALVVAGPAATELGFSLEDTSAILAKMADRMILGSKAGVALKGSLIKLANPSKEAARLLKSFGVAAGDDLFTRLGKIKKGLEAISDPTGLARLAAASEIFGQRFSIPMKAALSEGVDSLREFSEALTGSKGLAKRIADAKIDTLIGQFNILKSAIADVQIATGGELNPVLREMIDELQNFIKLNADKMAEGLAKGLKAMALGLRAAFIGFGKLLPTLKKAGMLAAAFLKPLLKFVAERPAILGALVALKVSGFLGLNTAIRDTVFALAITLRVAVGGAITLLSGMTVSMAFATVGLSLLAGAVAALGVAFFRTKEGQKLFGELMTDLKSAIAEFRPELQALAKSFGDMIKEIMPTLIDLFSVFVDLMKELAPLIKLVVGASLEFITLQLKGLAIALAAVAAVAKGIREEIPGKVVIIDRGNLPGEGDIRPGAVPKFRPKLPAGEPVIAPDPPQLGEPPSAPDIPTVRAIIDPGRSGFRELGIRIQDALLDKDKDKLAEKMLVAAEKQLDKTDEVVAAIEQLGESGGLA